MFPKNLLTLDIDFKLEIYFNLKYFEHSNFLNAFALNLPCLAVLFTKYNQYPGQATALGYGLLVNIVVCMTFHNGQLNIPRTTHFRAPLHCRCCWLLFDKTKQKNESLFLRRNFMAFCRFVFFLILFYLVFASMFNVSIFFFAQLLHLFDYGCVQCTRNNRLIIMKWVCVLLF